MSANELPCSHCGTFYSRRRLHCPKCHLPREDTGGSLPFKDRVLGLILLGVGIVIAVALCYFIYRTRFGRHAILLFAPLWLMLHGTLLLLGIHFRDFRAWWNQLRPLPRIALQALGILALALVVWFLLTARPG
ncbi:MAG: hypothetical protein L0Y72_31445 [Gemmataceae bacterium]|nr:hypothetical protein [Gemmataceae bacterium]MCI0743567.1 hypothetical protein [Gemmataceae bacterium]